MAISVAQTCMSSLGIGQRMVAHKVPSVSFSVQMGDTWRGKDWALEKQAFIFNWPHALCHISPEDREREKGRKEGEVQENERDE